MRSKKSLRKIDFENHVKFAHHRIEDDPDIRVTIPTEYPNRESMHWAIERSQRDIFKNKVFK